MQCPPTRPTSQTAINRQVAAVFVRTTVNEQQLSYPCGTMAEGTGSSTIKGPVTQQRHKHQIFNY